MSTNYVSISHKHCDHSDCEHELKHCKHCDVIFCDKCNEEWPKYKHQPYWYYYPNTTPVYPTYPITYPTWTVGNDVTIVNEDTWRFTTNETSGTITVN